jgi:hypothetical protein
MGMYGEVDIYATFNSQELADEVSDNLESKVIEFIKKSYEDKFSFEITDIELDDSVLIIKICSDRYQNAQWRTEQLFEYLKTFEGMFEFTAEMMLPETIISWNADDEL